MESNYLDALASVELFFEQEKEKRKRKPKEEAPPPPPSVNREALREAAEVAEWDRLDSLNSRDTYIEVVKRIKQFKCRAQCAAEAWTTCKRVEWIALSEGLPTGFFDMSIEDRIYHTVHRYNVAMPKKRKPKPALLGRPEKYDQLELRKNHHRWVVTKVMEDGFITKPAFDLQNKAEFVSWKMWESGKCKYVLAEKFEGKVRKVQ